MRNRHCLLNLLAIAVLASLQPLAHAQLYNNTPGKGDTTPLPAAAEVKALTVYPPKVTLKGMDDSAQLLVTAELMSGRQQDLTGDIKYEIANPAFLRVTTTGRLVPLANGATTVTATFAGKSVQVAVQTESCDVNLPINFTNHVVPIFTKLGCNSGGCHGKSGGQNGFALSLLGFVPEVDYQSLVKENRGRRLFPAAPDNSLLLTKATGTMAHAGGKRMEIGSDEYKLLRRWVAAGAPFGSEKDPVVAKITVHPEHRLLSRNNRQQFAVLAHYSDGSVQDVTQRAQYESNDQEIAVVDGAALVRSLEMSGEAGIMARYQGQVAVFRATVPLGMKTPDYKFDERTIVDRFTQKKWRELGIVPADLCSDEEFLRRVALDLTGTLPTPERVTKFLASKEPNKREQLIDELLERPEYGYLFANKWADVLRVKRRGDNTRAHGTFAFHNWIKESIAKDRPYDEFAREILGATGDETRCPPTVWYKELQQPHEFVDDTAQVFLGLRIACAQCHHHPYEKWSQDDYWGMAAFFGRIGRKNQLQPGGALGQQSNVQVIFAARTGNVINKRTGKPAEFLPLDSGAPIKIEAGEDPRVKLGEWLTSPSNPYFAKAVANRYWSHFFGRGIVDPIDDMRVTNPPNNPELLDALAQELIKNKFSLKQLVRTIVRSRTYQLSSIPNDFNKHDKQAFARFYPRRLSAEVMFDAVNQVTNSPSVFGNLPQDKHSPNRAIMLPDEGFTNYFLEVFGKPTRISACECERVGEANLAQALHLLNSNDIQGKLTRGGGRASLLANPTDKRPEEEKVRELFLWCFARQPSPEHLDLALSHVQRNPQARQAAYENILWALLNTKEFVFNR